jgi:hypothetical protein
MCLISEVNHVDLHIGEGGQRLFLISYKGASTSLLA